MSTNEINLNADSLSYPVEEAVQSGDLVVFASGLVGVAETDSKPNEAGNGFVATVRTKGVFSFQMGAGAVTTGVAMYASSTPSAGVGVVGTPTTTSTGNTLVGTVYRGKPAAAGLVYVRIGK